MSDATTIDPVHPGEILLEEFLKPMELSQNQLAMALHVPAPRINEIVRGKRSISADTALRLGKYFGMQPQFWMNLQSQYDLAVTRESAESAIDREVRPRSTLTE